MFEILLLVAAFAAAFVQATTGFAYAIIMMALLPIFMPVLEATQLLMFGSIMACGYITLKYYKHINFKIIAIPLAIGLIGTYIGVNALFTLDEGIVVKALGGLLILLALYFYFFSRSIHIPNNLLTASVAGAFSGLMGGLFNISGPPIALYCMAVTKDKEEYIATVQFYFVVLIAFKMIYLGFQQGFSEMVVTRIPIIILGSVAGMLLGLKVLIKLSINALKRLVYLVMVISGLWYILGP